MRISCDDLRWVGAVRTEPGAPLGAELEGSTSCARFLSAGSWFPAVSQSYLLEVDAPPGCAWQVASGAPWILVAGNSGTGPGQVVFTLEANSGTLRSGAITLEGQSYLVQQLSSSSVCSYQLTASSTSVPATGGGFLVAVNAPPGCAWRATSPVGWIRVVDGESGAGSATVTVVVEANPENLRSAEVTIAGQILRIDQAAGGCTLALVPADPGNSAAASGLIAAAGGTFTLNVNTNSGCEWAASTNASWLRIVSTATGVGSGVIRYLVEANGPAERSAAIIAGKVGFPVRQEASPCTFRLATAASWFPAAGGMFKVDLMGPPACPWSATSPVSWVHLAGVAPKADGATISLQLEENWYSARTATLPIAGNNLQVQQSGYGWPPGCSVRFGGSGSTWFPATIGQVTNALTVSAPAGCAWIATSSASWLNLSDGAAGVGSGTLTYTLQNNPGATRSAAITIGLQRFVVNQAGLSCDYSLSYSESWFAAAGGSFQVAANGPPECGFTATTETPWISEVSPAAGTGSAVIRFALEPNTSRAARSGQILIGGKTLTVRQSP